MPYTAAELAQRLGGEITGDGSVILTGFAAAATARPGDLTFAESESYFAAAEQSAASAILVSGDFSSASKVLLKVPNPRVAMAKVLPLFFPPDQEPSGIHPTAVIADSAQIDPSVHIGPYCVVGEDVRLGARCVLLGGNHVRKQCVLGEDVVLHPNVVLYPGTQVGHRVIIHAGTVIGSDGYGYVFDEGRHRKVLQLGTVTIQDDVEIGANAAIDRGALGPTVIGQGTKIDNLVHVAHNVSFGRHNLVMGQCGFGGSTELGDYCVIASQSGIADHLKLGPQVTVGAKSGVMRDIPPGGTVLGIPAQPDKQMKRQWIAVQQLPDLIKRVREAERELREIQAKLG
ncbi:MAG: UDP-3-O-(3-hydroxymyristoyl)glucosamine N-acyltransferase [Verrucomicrobia bacterium]|jgi:UDP-3-O-[3-hydroxymyristoyl] glucosamine N-acyltransferase|nr:UDP-3-O-(3-hydroxymyristoyl)glucosamine N-acyltransferase [Verrucomicrobiota bacterium]